MRRCIYKILSLLIIFVIIFSMEGRLVSSSQTNPSLEDIIEDIINWKKIDSGSTIDKDLINSEMLKHAGTTSGDWFTLALGRYNYPDNYSGYLAVIEETITNRYQRVNKLDAAKATEWHRIALAVSAAGGNPLSIGEFEGEKINLIADGTYNRGLIASPGRQGINGWIWGLITLDSKRYEVPVDAVHNRSDFIVEILNKQLPDGGWALTGNVSDPDVTAMAIQALSTYYNSENIYNYTSSKIKDEFGGNIEVSKSVREAIDEAMFWLSNNQTEDGDFYSWGTQNVESTVWVMLALISIGVDPLSDERFITSKGNTLLDGILKYRNTDGGFIHSFTYDKDNPSAKTDESNSMASEQALYGLVALWRQQNNMRNLYDMRNEFNEEEKLKITNVKKMISELSDNSTRTEVENVLKEYLMIDFSNRVYINNYSILRTMAIEKGVTLPVDENLSFSNHNNEAEEVILHFSASNIDEANAIINTKELTTNFYVDVVRLLYILDHSEDFPEKQSISIGLEKAFNEISNIQNEIDSINNLVKEKLYPFEEISFKDRHVIIDLMNRIKNLSEHDQKQILSMDDIIKTKTQIDNLYRAMVISLVSASLIIGSSIYLIISIKRRRKKSRMNKSIIYEGLE